VFWRWMALNPVQTLLAVYSSGSHLIFKDCIFGMNPAFAVRPTPRKRLHTWAQSRRKSAGTRRVELFEASSMRKFTCDACRIYRNALGCKSGEKPPFSFPCAVPVTRCQARLSPFFYELFDPNPTIHPLARIRV
jgi:hypothetical protein